MSQAQLANLYLDYRTLLMRINFFSLDVFFYLGGFLVSYTILDKKKLKFF